jgi:hypothetical protein
VTLKSVFTLSSQQDAPATTRRNLEAVYGRPLEALEEAWHTMLGAR